MTANDHIHKIGPPTQSDAFKVEFSKALAELLGKIRFRGQRHQEWIAEQIVHGLSEEPRIKGHLLDILLSYQEQEKESA